MGAEPDQPLSVLRRYWLRLRYTEHLGAQLSRVGVQFCIPLCLANLAVFCLFLGMLIAGLRSLDGSLLLLTACLVVVALLIVVTTFRMVVGYFLRDRYVVIVQAEGAAAEKPSLFDWLAKGAMLVIVWFLVPALWAVSLAVLYSIATGDFVPGQASAT